MTHRGERLTTMTPVFTLFLPWFYHFSDVPKVRFSQPFRGVIFIKQLVVGGRPNIPATTKQYFAGATRGATRQFPTLCLSLSIFLRDLSYYLDNYVGSMYLSSWSCWLGIPVRHPAVKIMHDWLNGANGCLDSVSPATTDPWIGKRTPNCIYASLILQRPSQKRQKQEQFAQLTVDGLWCLLLVLDPVTLRFLSPFLLLIPPLMVMSCPHSNRPTCGVLRSAATSRPDTPQAQAQQSHTETHHLLMRDGIPEDHWGGAYDGHVLRWPE